MRNYYNKYRLRLDTKIKTYQFSNAYGSYTVYLRYSKYRSNLRTCIQIIDCEDDTRLDTATISYSNTELIAENETVVKDLDILDFLILNGVVFLTPKRVALRNEVTGYVVRVNRI